MVLPLAGGSGEVVIMIYIDPCNINIIKDGKYLVNK